MTSTRRLAVACDGLELPGGSCMPRRPRGGVGLLHGIPSTEPPEPGDDGYAGLAARFAERGWVHGDRDDVVPVDHARRIAAAGRRVDLRVLRGGDHRLRMRADVIDLVIDWLDEVL